MNIRISPKICHCYSCTKNILEKSVYNRIIKFLKKNKLFYPFQFGFRQNTPTTMPHIRETYGMRDTAYNWLKLYFSDRRQYQLSCS